MSLTSKELHNFKSAIESLLKNIGEIDTNELPAPEHKTDSDEERLLDYCLEELAVAIKDLKEDSNVDMSQLAYDDFDKHLMELQTSLSLLLHLSDTDIQWESPPLPSSVLDIINKRKDIKKILHTIEENLAKTNVKISTTKSNIISSNPKLERLKNLIQNLNAATQELHKRVNNNLKAQLRN